MPRARVWFERLPFRKRTSRRLHRSINIRSRSLRDGRNCFSSGRISRLEEHAFGRLPPCAVDEGAEGSLMLVEPEQRVLRVFGRRAVFHGEEFFSYAHSCFPLSSSIFARAYNYAIGCR